MRANILRLGLLSSALWLHAVPAWSAEALPEIGHGYSNVINPSVLAIASQNGQVGSGTLVKKRCVLTAGHVAINVPAGAFASPGAGLNAPLTNTSARTGASRVSLLISFTANTDIDRDLGFMWLDPRAPRPPVDPAPPHIADNHATATINYGGINYGASARLEGIGYSSDCKATPPGSFGIQRYGYFTGFGGLFPTPAVGLADVYDPSLNTTVRLNGRARADNSNVFAVCPGDSGGPLLLPEEQEIVAVISGIQANDPDEFRAVETKPFEPWLVERLRTFCEPHFAVSIKKDAVLNQANVTGVADATVTQGQIIDCNGSGAEVCSFGHGSFEVSNPSDRLIGEGEVVLTGHNKAASGFGYDLCFLGWNAGPAGSPCPCDEYDPSSPYYTPSTTCTIQLIPGTQANSNELQSMTSSTWIPWQGNSGNICQPVYRKNLPGSTCPFPW